MARRSTPTPSGDAKAPHVSRPTRVEILVVFLAAIAAHAVSIGNHYALDDEIIILRNMYVQRGIAGIGDILGSDAYQSWYEMRGTTAPLEGGRYRPLSAVTFAIEQSVFGETLGDEAIRLRAEIARLGPDSDESFRARRELQELLDVRIPEANLAIAPHRHAIQVLLYAASMVALLVLLRRMFDGAWGVALVSTLFFALHPIHTEVVANVKSRDEILSLLFVVLAGIALFRFDEGRRMRDMVLASAFLALALFSKEYAVVAPLVLGSALVLARGRRAGVLARAWVPLAGVIVAWLVLRTVVIGEVEAIEPALRDVLNDPFLPLRLGTAEGSVLATKIAILASYLKLLVFPHPLSSDYSYATFPFADFASVSFWASAGVHCGLLALTVLAWKRRHPLAFAGVTYFAFLAPVSNVLVDIGATMGERLAYHASLGFAVLLGWLVVELPRRLPAPRAGLAVTWALVAAIALPYAVASARRDLDWRDGRALALADVETVPRSALANANAGARALTDALQVTDRAHRESRELTAEERAFVDERLERALEYLGTAVEIHPGHVNSWINIGLCRYTREEWDLAADALARGAPSRNSISQLYATNFHVSGSNAADRGDFDTAAEMFARAARAWPHSLRFHRDHAGASFMAMRFEESRAAFDAVLARAPGDPNATGGRQAAGGLAELERAASDRPGDPEALRALAAALASANPDPAFQSRAAELFREAQRLSR